MLQPNVPFTCRANQLTGFYKMETLVFNELSQAAKTCKKKKAKQNKIFTKAVMKLNDITQRIATR